MLTGSGLRRPAVRVVRDGEVVDPATWTRRARTGATTIDDLVDPARLLDLYAHGSTVVLQSLHRWWRPLTSFCDALGDELGHAVQANAYLTPPGAAGLAAHHDTHDVFVLQVHGSKRWTVRRPLVHAPLARHRSDHVAATSQPIELEAELGPGCCLYLPRGTIHSARAPDASSLHLTIGVLATTAHDLVRDLVDLAADVPALRRTLPPGWASDPALTERCVREVVADLVRFLDRIDTGSVAAQVAERRRPGRLVLDGQLLELDGLAELTDESVVRARSHGIRVAVCEADRLRLRLADRTLDLPATLSPAVERLLDGAAHRVGDLGDLLDGPSRLVLVRRLVREGLLRSVASHGDEQRREDVPGHGDVPGHQDGHDA